MNHAPRELTIRRLTSSDAEAFSFLRRAVTAADPVPMGLTLEEELSRPLQSFRDQLSYPEPNAAFGAFAGLELVGCSAVAWPSKFQSSRHKTNLWGVFVHPSHRSRGIGRALVKEAVEHAFLSGVRRVNLLVFVPNHAAVKLYASLGFIEYGREPDAVHLNGAYHDAIHMTLLRMRPNPSLNSTPSGMPASPSPRSFVHFRGLGLAGTPPVSS